MDGSLLKKIGSKVYLQVLTKILPFLYWERSLIECR